MQLKTGVNVKGLQPETLLAMILVNQLRAGIVITSINDSAHMKGSRHYDGYAFDVRTHELQSDIEKDHLVGMIRQSLTQEYDVVFESRGLPNEHIHVEFDPKATNSSQSGT